MNVDKLIKLSVSNRMMTIDDPDFTKRIIDDALKKKGALKPVPFYGFAGLIIGTISMMTNSGMLLLYAFDAIPKELPSLDRDTYLILVVLSATYLLYSFLAEVAMKQSQAHFHDPIIN